MELTCRLRKDPDNQNIPILMLKGEINSATSQNLQEALASLVTANDPVAIVNLSNVSYASSAGWRVFLEFVRQGTTQLIFVGMQPTVRDVYDLLGFARIAQAEDTVQSALKSLAQPAGDNPDSASQDRQIRDDVIEQVTHFLVTVESTFDVDRYKGVDKSSEFEDKLKRLEVELKCLKLTFHDYLLTTWSGEVSRELKERARS